MTSASVEYQWNYQPDRFHIYARTKNLTKEPLKDASSTGRP